jgi:hypothetical protein
MIPKSEIDGTQDLSLAEMQRIVGGDGWLQAIGAAWSTGVGAIGGAIKGLFASSPSEAVLYS